MREDLVTVAYRSRADHSTITECVLAEILTTAQACNIDHRVTGALAYDSGYFVQVLEGSSAAVDWIMRRIRADRRHHSLDVIGPLPAKARRFADWCMVCLSSEPGLRDSLKPLMTDWATHGHQAPELIAQALDGDLPKDIQSSPSGRTEGGST